MIMMTVSEWSIFYLVNPRCNFSLSHVMLLRLHYMTVGLGYYHWALLLFCRLLHSLCHHCQQWTLSFLPLAFFSLALFAHEWVQRDLSFLILSDSGHLSQKYYLLLNQSLAHLMSLLLPCWLLHFLFLWDHLYLPKLIMVQLMLHIVSCQWLCSSWL